MRCKYVIFVTVLMFTSTTYDRVYATPFFENGYFTQNGIEWCQENLPLYEIMGNKFFEHHRHSLESRVCASLYEDPLWNYTGSDRVQRLIERSQYYSQLEIAESNEEAQTGIIDTNPAAIKDETLLRGMTQDGQIMVQVIATKPIANTPMQINISFLDKNNYLLPDVSYEIRVTQQDKQIVPINEGHTKNGLVTILTVALESDKPVDISISIIKTETFGDSKEVTEYQEQIVMFTVVPEFANIAILVFAGSITSVMVISRHIIFQRRH